MAVRYIEENGQYALDCTQADWSADGIHTAYHAAGIDLKDVDWVVQDGDRLLLIEYKNADIPNASNPGAFQPAGEKSIRSVVQKYYDSLHYLRLLGKTEVPHYVYVLESPNGDEVLRRRVRGLLKAKLPFQLQKNLGQDKRLISGLEVLSITQWNEKYPQYSLIKM